MNKSLAASIEKQLEELLADFEKLVSQSQHDDMSNLEDHDLYALLARAIAAIRRLGPTTSYAAEVERILENPKYVGWHVRYITGVARALLHDLKGGYLESVAELVHANVAGDYLEQARALLDSHYKDAAAVMIGAILEQRLKNLADKHGTGSLKGDGSAKSANSLNDELAAAGVYSKTEQKNVLAQLGLRNDAAHGHYSNYDEARVKLMLATVQHFLTLYPA